MGHWETLATPSIYGVPGWLSPCQCNIVKSSGPVIALWTLTSILNHALANRVMLVLHVASSLPVSPICFNQRSRELSIDDDQRLLDTIGGKIAPRKGEIVISGHTWGMVRIVSHMESRHLPVSG